MLKPNKTSSFLKINKQKKTQMWKLFDKNWLVETVGWNQQLSVPYSHRPSHTVPRNPSLLLWNSLKHPQGTQGQNLSEWCWSPYRPDSHPGGKGITIKQFKCMRRQCSFQSAMTNPRSPSCFMSPSQRPVWEGRCIGIIFCILIRTSHHCNYRPTKVNLKTAQRI